MPKPYVHSQAFLKKKYVPRGVVQNAVINGLRAGKDYPTIFAELKAAGKKVNPKSLYEQARQLRKRGITIPKSLPQQKMLRMLAILKAEEDGLSTGEVARQLKSSVTTIAGLKKVMRKKGIHIKKLVMPKKVKEPIPFTAKEVEWVSKNLKGIKRAIGIVSHNRRFSTKTTEDFNDFVMDKLPKVLRRYDPKKGMPLDKYVQGVIYRWLSRDFVRVSVAQMLQISVKETGRFFRFLLETQHGAGIVAASRKSGLTPKRARELSEMYKSAVRLTNGKVSYHDLREEK